MGSRSPGLRETSIRTARSRGASARPRRHTWRRFRAGPTMRLLRARNTIGSRSGSSGSRCTGNRALSASIANKELRRGTRLLPLTTGALPASIVSSPSTGRISTCLALRPRPATRPRATARSVGRRRPPPSLAGGPCVRGLPRLHQPRQDLRPLGCCVAGCHSPSAWARHWGCRRRRSRHRQPEPSDAGRGAGGCDRRRAQAHGEGFQEEDGNQGRARGASL